MRHPILLAAYCLSAVSLLADGPSDNQADKVRRQPPPGIKVSDDDRKELEEGVAALGQELDATRGELKGRPALLALLPDAQIYHKAVDWALRYDEFFNTNEVPTAKALLKQGRERAAQLRAGQAPWTTTTGLVVRGYVSRLDGSVQPYGLVVPPSFSPNSAHHHRLDAWFHGRGETLSELSFIRDRQRSFGEFTPRDALVLHPYGRYCNGQKFAGEVDFFEALDAVKRHYPVDENRLVVRGFSLGGAACWHIAAHHAGLWAAAAPGAGFSETADFLKVFQSETLKPTWYEQKLWHLYDCPGYAVNFFNCPTVAYSGEIDKQKQAADVMEKACAAEGLKLTHVIGPKTAHSYEKNAKAEINRRIDAIAAKGRDPLPEHVRFATWTLRYNEMNWVTVDGLEKHWDEARVDADLDDENDSFRVATKNISALTLTIPPGRYPFPVNKKSKVAIDGQKFEAPAAETDRSWTTSFIKVGKRWNFAFAGKDDSILAAPSATSTGLIVAPGLRKVHGLQGPIDDAFMDSFLMVRPTGTPLNEKVGAWVAVEQAHALEHWRRHFRGDARVKNDTEVSDADIAEHNLILWGDPSSNRLLAKIADKLPIQWNAQSVTVGKETFPSADHVPVLIHPNPLNPKKYVVLNSGFTFREYDYLNNARQTPKLPDYAVIDVGQPVTSRFPGGIATAGFFGERWEVVGK